MFISTATPTDEITEILNRKNLTPYFKDIKGSPQSKVTHVEKFRLNNNYFQNEMIFVGDSDSDKEAAIQNGILFIAVLSGVGMESEKYKINNLKGLKPLIDSIVHSP